jgi:hypothetical protein
MSHIAYMVAVFLGVIIWLDFRHRGSGSLLIGTMKEVWCIIKKRLKKTND